MTPMTAIVNSIPLANSVESQNAWRVEVRPCLSMKPTMSGMLARWQGLSNILSTPQTKAAPSATAAVPSTARVSVTNSSCSSFHPHLGKLSNHLFFGEEPDVAEEFLAILVKEDLDRD